MIKLWGERKRKNIAIYLLGYTDISKIFYLLLDVYYSLSYINSKDGITLI